MKLNEENERIKEEKRKIEAEEKGERKKIKVIEKKEKEEGFEIKHDKESKWEDFELEDFDD